MADPSYNSRYINCSHIPRPKEDYRSPIDKELEKAIAAEALVLPLFEREYHQYRQKRAVSIVHNEFLRCRWREFIKTSEQKTLFRFPNVNDLHFKNCSVRYLPNESVCNRVNNRYTLRMGPGVDKIGQIPLPDDMHVRKTAYIKPRDKKAEKKVMASKKKNDS